MHTRRECDAVAPGMKRNGNLVPRRQRRDLSDFGDAAGARDIRLDEIHRAAQNKIFEGVTHVQVLAHGDRRPAFLAQLRMPFDIFDKKRLFEPVGAAVRERVRGSERDIDVVPLIRIGHHDEVLAQFRAHRAYDANILIEVEADFDLDTVKTLIREGTRALRHFRRLFGIERGSVNRDVVPALAAKQLIEGHTARLAENIPERDVDPAECHDADTARAELFMAAPDIDLVPNLVDLRRVHADQQRLQYSSDDHLYQLAIARTGTDAGNAFIGFHLHQSRRPGVSHTGPAEDLALRGNRSAQADRLNVGDLHRRLFHFPKLAVNHLSVDDHEIDFLVGSLVAFVIDPQNFRLVTLLRADAKQCERSITRAGEIVIMILRQHDAFAFVQDRRLMVFVVKSRLPIHHDECVIFARVSVELILAPGNIVIESDRHMLRLGKRNMTPPAADMWSFKFERRSFHFLPSLAAVRYISVDKP